MKLTRKQDALLSLAESRSPMSIYRLAKLAGRPYRRVHDHIHQLAAMGKVNLREAVRDNRRVTLVVPNNVYYQRLMHLDELHAAYRELSAGAA